MKRYADRVRDIRKLTQEQATEIRAKSRLGIGSTALAKEYNVSRSLIENILSGRTYSPIVTKRY